MHCINVCGRIFNSNFFFILFQYFLGFNNFGSSLGSFAYWLEMYENSSFTPSWGEGWRWELPKSDFFFEKTDFFEIRSTEYFLIMLEGTLPDRPSRFHSIRNTFDHEHEILVIEEIQEFFKLVPNFAQPQIFIESCGVVQNQNNIIDLNSKITIFLNVYTCAMFYIKRDEKANIIRWDFGWAAGRWLFISDYGVAENHRRWLFWEFQSPPTKKFDRRTALHWRYAKKSLRGGSREKL